MRTLEVKTAIKRFAANFQEIRRLYSAWLDARTDANFTAMKAKYDEVFDWETFRDYMIFSDVVYNADGFSKNWQWTTYDGQKWNVNAYDLDVSLGCHWQGTQIYPPATGHIAAWNNIPAGFVYVCHNSELEERYAQLRDAGIIEAEHVLSYLKDWVSRIGTGNYDKEYCNVAAELACCVDVPDS